MLSLNDSEKTEIQKTIHTEGWRIIIKLFEDSALMSIENLLSPIPLNSNVDYERGRASAWKEAQTLPYNTANREI